VTDALVHLFVLTNPSFTTPPISSHSPRRELESILFDLQESIRKRNPDSVSNLIRAATVSDEVRAERMEQSQLIADLTAELAGEYFFLFLIAFVEFSAT
jgi:hypothetical protein